MMVTMVSMDWREGGEGSGGREGRGGKLGEKGRCVQPKLTKHPQLAMSRLLQTRPKQIRSLVEFLNLLTHALM